MTATEKDIKLLNDIYQSRKPFFGDLHNHSDSGGTSDGKCTLKQWREGLSELKMDFAAILDHRQVRHMYEDEWEDGVFIGGTEPGTYISDSKAENKCMHYNMLFENAEPLEKLLSEFSEFAFEGGREGHFGYPDFTKARMVELIDFIKDNGGFFVYPHPTQIMKSENPEDFWFADGTGFEVIYFDMTDKETADNYKLWCDLLNLGKKIFACAGEDGHKEPSANALTAIYAEEKTNAAYLKHLRVGDFVCGNVGIKMCVGDCAMGGSTDMNGKTLVVSVGDFHESVNKKDHTYKLVVYKDDKVIAEEAVFADKECVFSYNTEECKFYRVEVFDTTENLRIAIGNPIWSI